VQFLRIGTECSQHGPDVALELALPKQVGVGMWKEGEFVDMEWIYLAGENTPQPDIDARLAQSYPFRLASDRRLPPIFT